MSRALSSTRRLLRIVATIAALAAALRLPAISIALGQQPPTMDRTGTVEIQNDVERAAFAALTCSCGTCPHESLVTCPCGFATEARSQIRAMLQGGMTLEQVKTEWAKMHGPESLALPPNTGANRLIYMVPLFAIVLGAGALVMMLQRFRRRSEQQAASAPVIAAPTPGAAKDEYDEKLDDELRQLDDE